MEFRSEKKEPASAEKSLWDLDARIGEAIFRFVQANAGIKLLCEMFTLLVDELVFIVLLVAGWFGTLSLRSSGYANEVHCLPETFVDCYLLFMTWNVIEGSTKLLLRRPRPAYGKQKKPGDVLIPGDQFSLPSGHSMRAFAMARVAHTSPSLQAAGYLVNSDWEVVLLLLASGAAFSRVGLGRHSPLDVIIGSLLGSAIGGGYFLSPETRFNCQLIAASYFAVIGVAACISATARRFLGIEEPIQVAMFLSLPMWGSWFEVAGRFGALGRFHEDQVFRAPQHAFQECGMPGAIGEPNELFAGLSMTVCAFGLCGAVCYGGGLWKLLLPAAMATIGLTVELLVRSTGMQSLVPAGPLY
jgi:membrane-associated phospholipid phosphatase